MPFVLRWIARSIGMFVLSRAVRYARSPQGRRRLDRAFNRLRRR